MFSIESTLGAAQIGFSVSCVVFGILVAQAHTYFKNFPADRAIYKLLIVVLLLLEFANQILIGHFVYFYTITNFANPLVIVTENIVWSLIVQAMVGNVVGTIVKFCFTMRVWTFSGRNIIITAIISLLVLTQFGCAIVYTVKSFHFGKFIFNFKVKTIATIALSAGVITDFSIAFSLCFFLRRLRTGHRESDSLIYNLSVYAISTGALTSAVSLGTLILYNTYPETFYFTATYFILGQLYAISFLCALNTRQKIRRAGNSGSSGLPNRMFINNDETLSTDNGRFTLPAAHGAFRPSQPQTKSMEIDVHVLQDVVITTETWTPRSQRH